MRNEVNLTQENPWAGGKAADPANPTPESVFIRVVIHVGIDVNIHVGPWPKKPYPLTRRSRNQTGLAMISEG